MNISTRALELLDKIETIEMRSLEWGFTDGSLVDDEVYELGDHICGEAKAVGADGQDLAEELINSKLIFETTGAGGEVRMRSRFAEMMRLLAANRQLFPNKPWQGAPSLVSDFRVDRRPRRFPRRDCLPTDVLAANSEVLGATPLRRDLWSALTARPGMQLASFQVRAALRLAIPTDDGGTIVTAGTGSGKTIAFYLPAMIRIGEAIGANHWVKAIAIYPRIELLKDQFGEAYRMARSIDGALQKDGKRPLTIGALFAATPTHADPVALTNRKWHRRGEGFVCPWMRCPTCEAELVWRSDDVTAGRERLHCVQRDCSGLVPEDRIILTRRRLQKQPPDILFTTTEMLNQRLSDQWMCGLFGVDRPAAQRPLLALLDEVHTYEGASGAQAALTLRRWRHRLGHPISWVGLSATLGDASRFFADLTGAHPDQVVEITPTLGEFVEQGAEYQILLRGDPASRASLLSSTIQTAMLVSRLLDPPGSSASGAFGRRAFLFTDDLDVTNRLFDDLRDAEGYTIYGKPDPQRVPLANIRRGGVDAAIRDLGGQRWRICEDIGHPLDRRLIVGRTTSQDGGVNQSANIIVATAALEVGFNDPHVGAVIQHKAPRGMASFLQRKGRAGRDRVMRPIMLTMLSDYGRDRAFYQAFEHLFDPTLEAQHLPIQNPHVLKIQAVFALFDWLALRTTGQEKAWQWEILSGPPKSNSSPQVQTVLKRSKEMLAALIQGDETVVDDLRSYLAGALQLSPDVVEMLLWEAPRSLMLEAIPTLVRRVFRNWKLAIPADKLTSDLMVERHPLPDFVPSNLFSDLALPEVGVIVPPADVKHQERTEGMPILQALNQFPPGRVTRRFAYERGGLSHWVPVDPTIPIQKRRISDYAETHQFVGTFTGRLNGPTNDGPLLVYRPWTIRLGRAERSQALPSSNARLLWQSDIEANGEALGVPVPSRSQWHRHIIAVDFHLHRFRSSVSVRRFARTVHANIRTLKDDFPVAVHFVNDEDCPAAVGFELEVDGFRVDIAMPSVADIADTQLSPEQLADARLAYLRESFRENPELPDDLNVFQRDWLFEFLICVLLGNGSNNYPSLEATIKAELDEDRLEAVFRQVMDTQFGAIPPNLPDNDDTDSSDADDEEATNSATASSGGPTMARGTSRLQQGLLLQLSLRSVRNCIRMFATQFVVLDQPAYQSWLHRMILNTLGEAVLQACIASAPRQATVDTLLVDIDPASENGIASIWISETTPGGGGVLEAFAERFASEPRLFFTALDAALAPTDLELVDHGLKEILTLSLGNAEIAQEIARLRATQSHGDRADIWQTLTRHLTQKGGIDLSHALSVSLNNRLLRAGSGPDLDKLLFDLQAHWDRTERRFGISVGLREFAYIASTDPTITSAVRHFLATTLPAAAIGQVTVLSAITSLLWPRAHEIRQRSLQSYNPFRGHGSTDPAILRQILMNRSACTINIDGENWEKLLDEAFAAQGTARLVVEARHVARLRALLIHLIATPVGVGVLQFFPAIERFERADGQVYVTLTLREQV